MWRLFMAFPSKFVMLYTVVLVLMTLRNSHWFSGKTVITSDHALKLEFVPDWIAIVGSGYIGLEFSDVYTALGSEVSMVYIFLMNFL